MRYRVVFGDDDPTQFGSEDFEADELSDALFHIASLHSRQPVELWCEEHFLGRLKHIVDDSGSYWKIGR